MGIVTNLPTLNDVQVMAISEALFEGFFKQQSITDLLDIQTGIKAGKEIVIFKRHTGLAGYERTPCDTTANSTWGINSVAKKWEPQFIGDRFAECFGDYMAKFIRWGLKNGVEKDDLTGTELAAFIIEQMDDLIYDVVMRWAYFADKGIAATTNNNLVAGQLKYFNQFDGIFAQLFDIVAADATRLSTTGLTTKNAAASKALQRFNDTDTTNQVVTKALDKLFYDADMRLRETEKSQLVIEVTQSVYDQYERERKANGGGAILEVYNRQEGGVPPLASNGIEVKPIPFWDRMIQTYFEDGTVWYLPQRAILRLRNNFIIGTEEANTLSELDPWYSKDDEKMYIKFGFQLDAKIGLDNMVQAAY